MNSDHSRPDIDRLWTRVDQEAVDAKFSQMAVLELSRLYRSWDTETQRTAREQFGHWLHSDNARKRFDALALIREFSVSEAIADLHELKKRLEGEAGPEASFELRKVQEILMKLGDKA